MSEIRGIARSLPLLESIDVSPPKEHREQLSFSQTLAEFSERFRMAERGRVETISRLPSEFRGIFELQASMNRINLEVNLVSKVAESAGASLRRLQTVGG